MKRRLMPRPLDPSAKPGCVISARAAPPASSRTRSHLACGRRGWRGTAGAPAAVRGSRPRKGRQGLTTRPPDLLPPPPPPLSHHRHHPPLSYVSPAPGCRTARPSGTGTARPYPGGPGARPAAVERPSHRRTARPRGGRPPTRPACWAWRGRGVGRIRAPPRTPRSQPHSRFHSPRWSQGRQRATPARAPPPPAPRAARANGRAARRRGHQIRGAPARRGRRQPRGPPGTRTGRRRATWAPDSIPAQAGGQTCGAARERGAAGGAERARARERERERRSTSQD